MGIVKDHCHFGNNLLFTRWLIPVFGNDASLRIQVLSAKFFLFVRMPERKAITLNWQGSGKTEKCDARNTDQ